MNTMSTASSQSQSPWPMTDDDDAGAADSSSSEGKPTTATEDTIIARESPFLCNWVETKLRLANEGENNNITYLCLPDTSQFSDDESDTDTIDIPLSFIQLDQYLATLPQLVLSTQRLLPSDTTGNRNTSIGNIDIDTTNNTFRHNNTRRSPPSHQLITASNSGRVINVLQGEIAHCAPSQADTLVSDDATTCHIVAIWSRYMISESKEGATLTKNAIDSLIATMAHIDQAGYEKCISDAVDEHVKYHSTQLIDSKTNKGGRSPLGVIEMSLHIMGGFNDHNGSSIAITHDILQTFAAVSRSYARTSVRSGLPRLQVTLETCAVVTANDDGTGCPLGRGLAMDVHTGKVFLAEVDNDAEYVSSNPMTTNSNDCCISSARGPACTLRSIRGWASAFLSSDREQMQRLSIIHQPISDSLVIEPFFFASHNYFNRLLELNDDQLLQQTSTSPGVEKSNFVSRVRNSFLYMNQNTSSKVFRYGKPLKYNRVGLNGWVRSD
jgi:hypothetical protein